MQRTLKRESKVLEIAERKTIATDRCGLHHDPSLVGFRKNQRTGRIVFFPFFIFFFLPFSFFVSKGGRCLDWWGLGQHRFGGRQTTAVEVGPPRRSRGGSLGSRRGGGEIFFFFSPSRADRLSSDRFGRLRSRNLRRPQAIVRWTEVKKISQDDVRP